MARQLDVQCEFGNLSVGDQTARLGVKIDRQILESLDMADTMFGGVRLDGEIKLNGSAQQTLDGMEPEPVPEVSAVFDSKGFRVSDKSISLGLTFALSGLEIGVLQKFVKRFGRLTVDHQCLLSDLEPEERDEHIDDLPNQTRIRYEDDPGKEPLESMGLKPGQIKNLNAAGISTVSELESAMSGNAEFWHRDISGIGQAAADDISEKQLAYRQQHGFGEPDEEGERQCVSCDHVYEGDEKCPQCGAVEWMEPEGVEAS